MSQFVGRRLNNEGIELRAKHLLIAMHGEAVFLSLAAAAALLPRGEMSARVYMLIVLTAVAMGLRNANANGVLYSLGSGSGGLTCFVEDGILCYEYNLFIIQRTKIRAKEKLPIAKVKIEI